MATMLEKSAKILITASSDVMIDKLANDLHLARVALLQQNPIYSENLNFIRYEKVLPEYSNVQNYSPAVQIMHETNATKRQELYKNIILNAKIVFCPYHSLYKLNK